VHCESTAAHINWPSLRATLGLLAVKEREILRGLWEPGGKKKRNTEVDAYAVSNFQDKTGSNNAPLCFHNQFRLFFDLHPHLEDIINLINYRIRAWKRKKMVFQSMPQSSERKSWRSKISKTMSSRLFHLQLLQGRRYWKGWECEGY